MIYWKYLIYILKHKYFVFLGGLKYKVPIWRLITHDWDKLFIPHIFLAFAVHNFGKEEEKFKNWYKYLTAVRDHLRSKHHFENWLVLNPYKFADGTIIELPIPEEYLREMIADWYGAGMSKGNKIDPVKWYEMHSTQIRLNLESRRLLEKILYE